MRDRSIYVRNIYHMLCYALRDWRPDAHDELAAEEFEGVHDLFAWILSRGMARRLKQGLHRAYVERAAELPFLRGRVDMASTARSRLACRCGVACVYDELSEDELFNRVLKSCALLLVRCGRVCPELRAELKRRLLFFAEVGELDCAAIPWQAMRFTRATRDYRLLMAACRLLVSGMLAVDGDGRQLLDAGIRPESMARLYEKFVLGYYRAECRIAQAAAPQIPWALDGRSCGLLPVMQSDVVLSRGPCRLVIDAKYYGQNLQENRGARTVHSGNLYQIFAYVKNLEAALARAGEPCEVSGILLYAKTDAQLQPRGAWQIDGSRIEVATLDLERPFPQLRVQLDAIAERYFGSASTAASSAPAA